MADLIPSVSPARFRITRRNGEQYTVLVDAEDLQRVLASGPWHIGIPTGAPRSKSITATGTASTTVSRICGS